MLFLFFIYFLSVAVNSFFSRKNILRCVSLSTGAISSGELCTGALVVSGSKSSCFNSSRSLLTVQRAFLSF